MLITETRVSPPWKAAATRPELPSQSGRLPEANTLASIRRPTLLGGLLAIVNREVHVSEAAQGPIVAALTNGHTITGETRSDISQTRLDCYYRALRNLNAFSPLRDGCFGVRDLTGSVRRFVLPKICRQHGVIQPIRWSALDDRSNGSE